jgi:DNA-binding NtrC family response regulator
MTQRQHAVYVVDDDNSMREATHALLSSAGYLVETFPSAIAFLEHERDETEAEPSCLVLDVHMPDLDGYQLQSKLRATESKVPIIFVTGHGDIPSTVRALKAGAMEYFTKPFDPDLLLEAIERAVQWSALRAGATAGQDAPCPGIIGHGARLHAIMQAVSTVAKTDATVLVHGETGTGKELVARAIHVQSERKGAFVKLNCAAVPANLLESELMGHEKGAFTGAIARRTGRFEAAQDGTLFLDEIGEMPPELQPKLLRLLQEREFERLGSNQTIRSTARVVAATNRDLSALVGQQRFREDLFYRLNVFPIEVPPLRERKEDIPDLTRHFLTVFARRTGRQLEPISPEFFDRLCAHNWPGNIRELMNVIERAAILATDGVLPMNALASLGVASSRMKTESTAPPPPAPPVSVRPSAVGDRLEDVERKHIVSVLEATNWVIGGPGGAAVRLGMKRPTLIYRMKKLGIERAMRRS